MKKFYSTLLISFVLAIFSLATTYGQSIIYVGGGENSDDYASDQEIMDSLTMWGYSVQYYDDDIFSSTPPSYAGIGGVFFHETVGSSAVLSFGPDDDNYPVPCVCLEGWSANPDRWAWVDDDTQYLDGEGVEDGLTVVIHDTNHYITKVFDMGEEITWSTNTGADLSSIKLRSLKEVNVEYTAKLGKSKEFNDSADYWAMMAIEESASIPSRIFWWGLNNWALNGSDSVGHYGTNDLFKILKRGCDWAYGNELVPVEDQLYENNYELTTYPNPVSDQMIISFTSPSVTNAVIKLYSLTGQELDVIFNDKTVQGNNKFILDATKYDGGVYLIRLQIDDYEKYSKVIIQ